MVIEKLYYGYKTITDENGNIKYYDITCQGYIYEKFYEVTEEKAKELETMIKRRLTRIRTQNEINRKAKKNKHNEKKV